MKKIISLFGIVFVMAFALVGNSGHASAAAKKANRGQLGSITIMVADAHYSTPVAGASVLLVPTNNTLPSISGYTDSYGSFSTVAEHGVYRVRVSANGYTESVGQVVLIPNGTATLNVQLVAASPNPTPQPCIACNPQPAPVPCIACSPQPAPVPCSACGPQPMPVPVSTPAPTQCTTCVAK